MLKNVAAVLLNGVHPFELGVVCEVFGIDRSDEGLPVYDFAVVSAEGPDLGTHCGFTVSTPHGLERLEEADLIAVPAGESYVDRDYPPELLAALRRAVERGARVLSVCSGVFVLAAAGLLDGRRCAVHWHHAEQLALRYPRLAVEQDVLYVDEDPVITSAGTAAGIDACLHLVRKEQGPEVANKIARRMVVPPHRDGGQAQYIERPLPKAPCDSTSPSARCAGHAWSLPRASPTHAVAQYRAAPSFGSLPSIFSTSGISSSRWPRSWPMRMPRFSGARGGALISPSDPSARIAVSRMVAIPTVCLTRALTGSPAVRGGDPGTGTPGKSRPAAAAAACRRRPR
ncbi:DJ-1/PfpI family protein [Streptomyces sp. SID6137]|uniref:DJ-1/PfpI family protein n=1 Tax=Streptomyces sp. SID6137 TaxID=2690319 RepID=UPI001F177184